MNRLWYGGDYNPEQWPSDVWDEDVRLMQRAGVTVATVGVFSWAKLEPADGVFEFGWLDDILDRLHAGGIRVDLATATASPPAWLVRAHPDMLPVTKDGVRLSFGSRQHYHPSSATYRRYADRLVRALAERYGTHPALEAWHVNNELACHVPRDYSEESGAAFRAWLEARYATIEVLNDAWGTAFWSQAYGSFDEIEPPRATPTFHNPTQLIDFDRFSSDAWLECYRAEAAILRSVTPDVPVTTNFMGFFKPSNYWSWAPELDFVSDDAYPDPADPASPAYAAMTRDLIRSVGNGRPWILMEQAASAVNWRTRNAPKPPGMHRLLSLQAVARGADGIMQFQWRQSKAGAEKFHSGMLPHGGEQTRVFEETVALGEELKGLSEIIGARQEARAAILFDWDSWWALEQEATPSSLSYVNIVFRWYRELWSRGILTDFARPDADLSGYSLVLAPATLVLSKASQRNLAGYVDGGGTLLATYQTGILDENLHVLLDGYLGELRSALGVKVEEFAPPADPSMSGGPVPTLTIQGLGAGVAREWGEVVRVTEADVRATFAGGMLDGLPAITRNSYGSGAAWYVATSPDDLRSVLDSVLLDCRLLEAADSLAAGVEVVRRGDFLFILNHGANAVTVDGMTIPGLDAAIVRFDGDSNRDVGERQSAASVGVTPT
jgi:beta-galactosidase